MPGNDPSQHPLACISSIRGASCAFSLVFRNKRISHNTGMLLRQVCSSFEVLASRSHAWIVHPSLSLTDRTAEHRGDRLRKNSALVALTIAGSCDSWPCGFFRGFSQPCVLVVKSDQPSLPAHSFIHPVPAPWFSGLSQAVPVANLNIQRIPMQPFHG